MRQESVASADTFIDAALRFLGDADPSAGSPWDKGARLGGLVGRHRALLVLDGLEPLQSAQAFDRGKLRDPALESLLRSLARQSAGLCLITTREPLTDLAARPGVTLRDLEQINPQAGRALLRTARVAGTDAELESLASRFGPHALAVSLLGVYLYEQPGHGVGPARALEQLPGEKPIGRVLTGFEQWLGDGAERQALRLLGFFDRPADAGCLRALRKAPAVPGLNERLTKLSVAEWNRTLDRLEKLRLIHVQQDKANHRVVDAHPLIREHFAMLLRESDVWRAGHRRLYEHLCTSTPDKPNATLEDLQPLYQAVVHGCQAGLQQEARETVYRDRISRGREAYVVKKLGAFGSDLGAVACFFDTPWHRVSSALTEADQGWLLSQAAFRLRALGRLSEALEPMRAGLEMDNKLEDWENVAISASNLSELELALGEVAGAVANAGQSVIHADRSGDANLRMANRTAHADALHHAGRRAEAEARFVEAEEMWAKTYPNSPLMSSLLGFRYCDLLLSASERGAQQVTLRRKTIAPLKDQRDKIALQSCDAVTKRAAQTLEWSERWNNSILDIALDHLTLGRAALYTVVLKCASSRGAPAQTSPSSPLLLSTALQRAIAAAATRLNAAVDGLRRSGNMDDLPRGLLTRAWLRSLSGAMTTAEHGPDSAQSDLDEATEIAERGPMPLFMADIHLYRARLFFGVTPYPWAQHADGSARGPKDDLAKARRLIEKHGYWRRKEELEDAEAAARYW